MSIPSRQSIGYEGPPSALLLAGLARFAPLSPKESALVLAHEAPLRAHRLGLDLASGPMGQPRQHLLVSGWAGRLKVSRDGRRQVVSTILPGELYSDPRPLAPFADYPLTALTEAYCMEITSLVQVVFTQPGDYAGLVVALTKALVVESDRLLEQVARLGKCTAYERVAQWLLETYERLEASSPTGSNRFPMPLTQELIGDTLGMSIVHVNRIVQQLRGERLIEMKGGFVTLLNPGRLAAVSDYTPTGPHTATPQEEWGRHPPTSSRPSWRLDNPGASAFREHFV